jgi:hypothetical protein
MLSYHNELLKAGGVVKLKCVTRNGWIAAGTLTFKVVFLWKRNFRTVLSLSARSAQRLQEGEKEPDFVGCAKGAHQILYERSIVEASLVTGSSIPCAQRTARQQALFDFLEEEGRMDSTNPDQRRLMVAHVWLMRQWCFYCLYI